MTSPVTFRLLYHDAVSTSQFTLAFTDANAPGVQVFGSVAPVPEPATVGLLAAAGLAAVGFVRRRMG